MRSFAARHVVRHAPRHASRDAPRHAARHGVPLAVLALFAAANACTCGEQVEAVVVELRVSPLDVSYGALPIGARAVRTISIANDGNGPYNPEIAPVIDGAGFVFDTPCALPLAPRDFCEMVVAFVPATEGEIGATLVIQGPDGPINVALSGVGEPADVEISPPELDFGGVDVGTSARQTLTVTSRTDTALSLEVVIDAPGFLIGGAQRVPLVLAAGASQTLDVDFLPARGGPFSARAVVELCGALCGPSSALVGEGLAPRISADPIAVDFGEVAAGTTSTRDIALTNTGAGTLVITRLDLLTANDDVALAPATLPLEIAEGQGATLSLSFSPARPIGALDANLRIRSNDPISPDVLIPIDGSAPGPAIQILPGVANFGVLDEGDTRLLNVVIRSIGTVPAAVTAVRIDGAAFDFEIQPSPTTLEPGASILFSVRATATAAEVAAGGATGAVTASADGVDDVALALAFFSGTTGCQPRAANANANIGAVPIGRGSSALVVLNNVGDAPCILDDTDEVPGFPFDPGFTFSAARARELLPGATGSIDFGFTAVDEGQANAFLNVTYQGVPPILISATARGVRGSLIGEPPLVEFGPVSEICTARERNATFVNDGGGTVTVSRFDLDPANAPFNISGAAPVPVAAGGIATVTVRPRQVPPGTYEADVVATTEDNLEARVRVRLIVEPEGVPVTETFIVDEVSAVDVLFVVDDSGSMGDDQDILASNFQSFIDTAFAETAAVDFHIGVTTTDVLGGTGGPLVAPYLTPSTGNLEDAFAAQALVGTDGNGIELGLEAMDRALSDFAATRNAGFLRDDAALSVIIVSDEEDGGGDPFLDDIDPSLRRDVQVYIDLLASLKAGSVSNAPVLVSVVVDPSFSTRYQTVAQAFSGVVLNIVSEDWGTQLSQIGSATFGLQRLFRLASPPQPGTVVVEVDGVTLDPSEYSVDTLSQTVTLNEAPAPGSVVDVTYEAGCS